MELQRKALYNLLQLNKMPGTDATLLDGQVLEPWQMQNYRILSNHELIRKLQNLNIGLEVADFEAYAKNYDSPEEMAEGLTGDLDHKIQDQAYLILFELWRRLLPENQPLSIFCDELDHQIMRYDSGETKDPADIQESMIKLQTLLDENVESGLEAHKALVFIQNHLANDLESFLYDYILEEIEAGNDLYASELLAGFSKYVNDSLWFDFLNIRLELLKESDNAFHDLRSFIEILKEKNQIQLNLEVLQYLSKNFDPDYFISLASPSLKIIELEEDFEDFATIAQSFFHHHEQNEKEKICQELLEKHSKRNLDSPISPFDPDIIKMKELISA